MEVERIIHQHEEHTRSLEWFLIMTLVFIVLLLIAIKIPHDTATDIGEKVGSVGHDRLRGWVDK